MATDSEYSTWKVVSRANLLGRPEELELWTWIRWREREKVVDDKDDVANHGRAAAGDEDDT